MPPASTAPSWAVSPTRTRRAPVRRARATRAARSSVQTWDAYDPNQAGQDLL